MNDITFKIAGRGEGKTKWLLNIAKEFHDKNIRTVLYTYVDDEYRMFCEKYFNLFGHVCPVEILENDNQVDHETVVLIDDLLSYNISLNELTRLQSRCYKMFVTIEGTTNTTTI